MESDSSFYIICPSNASMNLYSDNKPGVFRINLPKRIKLRGRYEVGLAEITYPITFDTFNSVEAYGLKANYKGNYGITACVPKALYLSVDELITELIPKISTSQGWRQTHHLVRSFTYDKLRNRIIHRLIDGLSVQLSQELSEILGYKENDWLSSSGTATYPPDIRNGLHEFFVYSNIVEPQLVGDVYAPLLRTVAIPAKLERGAQERMTYDSPHYVPVLMDEISTIEINIKRDTGENISFATGKTVCTLHFRRKTL